MDALYPAQSKNTKCVSFLLNNIFTNHIVSKHTFIITPNGDAF